MKARGAIRSSFSLLLCARDKKKSSFRSGYRNV